MIILDGKLYDNAIQKIISNKSKFQKLNEDPTLKSEASLQASLNSFLTKMDMINCILLVLLLLVCIYGTPKMQKFSASDTFSKLSLIASSVGTFNYDLACFCCDFLSPEVPDDYFYKNTFSFVSQIRNTVLSCKFLVFYDVTGLFTNIPLQENIDIAINLIFNHNPNLNITKKELTKSFSFLLHYSLTIFLKVNFIIKLTE